MNLDQIPFAKLIQLQKEEDTGTVSLPDINAFTNHLGTVSAAAQFSLAEIASGQWLLDTFPDLANQIVALIRSSQVTFKKPGIGKLTARITNHPDTAVELKNELLEKQRALFNIRVHVLDSREQVVMIGEYRWYLQLILGN
jgi:acyl-coenzyme A thioesterase PaaI-like protein